jgi:hypothetical protein
VHDLSAVVHASAIKANVPILNFYGGFESHQIKNIDFLDHKALETLIHHELRP